MFYLVRLKKLIDVKSVSSCCHVLPPVLSFSGTEVNVVVYMESTGYKSSYNDEMIALNSKIYPLDIIPLSLYDAISVSYLSISSNVSDIDNEFS